MGRRLASVLNRPSRAGAACGPEAGSCGLARTAAAAALPVHCRSSRARIISVFVCRRRRGPRWTGPERLSGSVFRRRREQPAASGCTVPGHVGPRTPGWSLSRLPGHPARVSCDGSERPGAFARAARPPPWVRRVGVGRGPPARPVPCCLQRGRHGFAVLRLVLFHQSCKPTVRDTSVAVPPVRGASAPW